MTDWTQEFYFWSKKAHRAFLRFEDALERDDQEAAVIAGAQLDRYNLMMKTIVPEEVHQEWDQKKAEEKQAALDEINE